MRLEILIDGMLAVHARHAVFTALGALPGVVSAEVELGRAVIECEVVPENTLLRATIADAGFALRAVRPLPRSLPLL